MREDADLVDQIKIKGIETMIFLMEVEKFMFKTTKKKSEAAEVAQIQMKKLKMVKILVQKAWKFWKL